MFTVKVKNIDKVAARIRKTFDVVIDNKSVLARIGNFVKDRIIQFSRAGKSLPNERAPFPQLTDSSAITRASEDFQNNNKPLSKFFLPNLARKGVGSAKSRGTLNKKSNITVTGQLLDSLKARLLNSKNRGSILIEASGIRTWGDSKKMSNKHIAKELDKNGFQFLGLDKAGKNRVRNLVLTEIRKEIKKLFPKSK